MLEKIEARREGGGETGVGAAEDEIVRWHHWLHGHKSEQTPGDCEGQQSLACKELDMT